MTLSTPQAVQERLQGIENDLALRQNALEAAALSWYRVKREREHKRAVAFLSAEGTVAVRSAIADRDTSMIGVADEAEYEALRAVTRVLETRATIGMALMKSHGRS